MSGPTVLKIGGELLASDAALRGFAAAIARLTAAGPLVIIHGGGKEVDRELRRRGLQPRMVDGLRVTDEETLETVVATLAGGVNTRLVAALVAAGARGVGLTGADDGLGLAEKAAPLRSVDGAVVDLGRVGTPIAGSAALVRQLCESGFVPVVASIGVQADGALLNLNADTLAAHLAGTLGARRLLIAGTTAGVLDRHGRTVAEIDVASIPALSADGTVSAGMLAKLNACRHAVEAGVPEVMIVDGTDPATLEAPSGSTIVARTESGGEAWTGTTRPAAGATAAALVDVEAIERRHLLPVYKRQPLVLVRGCGTRVFDAEGREYIDLVSGIGVASLGHAHPRLVEAITDQAGRLLHTSNLYFHALQARLASRLAEMSGLPRVFFCNSGTEAVEACLKLARRYWYQSEEGARSRIVALEHAFHGRTFGSLSVTWDEHYRAPFAPLLDQIQFVSADDPDALDAAVTDATAAVIVEPIQGEGGIRPLSRAFAQAVTAACERSGALLIADEVQSGLGRTGIPFYSAALGLRPDLMALGKALGGGVPIGAALASEPVSSAVSAGDHGSTYGGNLLACRAGLVFVEELMDRGVLANVRRAAARLDERLRAMAADYDAIVQVRGVGLMRGLELRMDAAPVVDAARKHGVLVNRTAARVVRLLPPLTVAAEDLDLGLDRLAAAIQEVTMEARV